MPRPLLIALGLAVIILVLAWFHVIPGGWFLRNLFESPQARETRLLEEHRQGRLVEFAAGPDEMPQDCILFLGSSTLERFPLEQSFPGRMTLNRGIGGEPARLMIERLEASVPKRGRDRLAAAVVYAGTIDFRIDRVEIAEVLRRLKALIARLRELTRPDLPILLLGPLPGNEDDDRYQGEAMMNLERAYRALATELDLDFLALARKPFRNDEGGLDEGLAVDPWHLGDEGYQLLADLIRAEGGRVGKLLAGK